MRRATGPGRVDDLPTPPSPPAIVSGLLFNFDIDDSTVKFEHVLWMELNVVSLLKSPGVQIGLRGTASRSGAASYNKQLSDRRVEAVKKHLIGRGAPTGAFLGFGAGEKDAEVAGEKDGTEDERFRAVGLTLRRSGRPGLVRLTRVDPAAENDGFDISSFPHRLMIPIEDPVRLMRVFNGAGLVPATTNALSAEVIDPLTQRPLAVLTSDDQVIGIRARVIGIGEITLNEPGGPPQARLIVAAVAKITVKVAFHYVQNAGVGTSRNPGDEVAMIAEMNEIYLPQVNIEFESVSARRLPIRENLGLEVNESQRLASGFTEWDVVTRNRIRAARFNVFFVRELEVGDEGDANPDDADALTTIDGTDCLFEDSAGTDVGETLAHEAGHALNIRHNTPITSTIDMLMWDTTDERGRFIPFVHMDRMRLSAVRS